MVNFKLNQNQKTKILAEYRLSDGYSVLNEDNILSKIEQKVQRQYPMCNASDEIVIKIASSIIQRKSEEKLIKEASQQSKESDETVDLSEIVQVQEKKTINITLSEKDEEALLDVYRTSIHYKLSDTGEEEFLDLSKQKITEIGADVAVKKGLPQVAQDVLDQYYTSRPIQTDIRHLEQVLEQGESIKEKPPEDLHTTIEREIPTEKEQPLHTKSELFEAEDLMYTAREIFEKKIKYMQPDVEAVAKLAKFLSFKKVSKDNKIEIAEHDIKHAGELAKEYISKQTEQAVEKISEEPDYSEADLNKAAKKTIDWYGHNNMLTTMDIPPIKEIIREKHPKTLPKDTTLEELALDYITEKDEKNKPRKKRRAKMMEGETPRSPVTGKKYNIAEYKTTRLFKYIINKSVAGIRYAKKAKYATTIIIGGLTACALGTILTLGLSSDRKPKIDYHKSQVEPKTTAATIDNVVRGRYTPKEIQEQIDKAQRENIRKIETKVDNYTKSTEKLTKKVNDLTQTDKKLAENDIKIIKRLTSTDEKVDIITELVGDKNKLRNLANLSERVELVEKEQKGLRKDVKEDIQELRKKYNALPDEVVKKVEEGFKKYLEKTTKETKFEPPKQEPSKITEVPEEIKKISTPKIKITENLKRKVRDKIRKLKDKKR